MACIKAIEIVGEQLLDVEDILIYMTKDWILCLIHAFLQDFHDNRLECLRIVDVSKVYDGVILHCCTQHLFYQHLCFCIYSCSLLDVNDFTEKAYDKISKLTLIIRKT